MNPRLTRYARLTVILCLSLGLQACVSTIVGTAVDVGIEVVKIPFKVGKAVVEVVSDDDKKKMRTRSSRIKPDCCCKVGLTVE